MLFTTRRAAPARLFAFGVGEIAMDVTPAPSSRRRPRWLRRPADVLIEAGFWSQLVVLFLLDWGTLHAFRKQGLGNAHVIGFVTVNVVLLATMACVRYLLQKDRGRSPTLASAVTDVAIAATIIGVLYVGLRTFALR